MRIVNREEFLKLPPGTFFGTGDRLEVKFDTLGEDFVCMNFCDIDSNSSDDYMEKLIAMESIGASFPVNQSAGRDGCFDKNIKFRIYELNDLLVLRGFLEDAIRVAKAGE